jgi:hypothetical protein
MAIILSAIDLVVLPFAISFIIVAFSAFVKSFLRHVLPDNLVAGNWFRSYLSERQQMCCVNGHSSNSHSLRCGVPQGTILGPLLFAAERSEAAHYS